MSKSTRLFLSLSEEEFQSFENARNELGYKDFITISSLIRSFFMK